MIPIEYLQTDCSFVYWDIGQNFNSNDVTVEFAIMPLTGTAGGGGWYSYFWGGNTDNYSNTTFLLRTTQIGNTGFCFAFGNNHHYGDYTQVQNLLSYDTKNVCTLDKSGITVNGVFTQNTSTAMVTPSGTIRINKDANQENGSRCQAARYYYFRVMSGATALIDIIPALDDNNMPCWYDNINHTYIYHRGDGNVVAGAPLHILTTTPDTIKFDASGGTASFTVAAETGWTCTTPSAFTISTTAGTSGDTVVTVTAANYTGATRIDEDIVLTDDDGYTANVHLRQKAAGVGQSSLYIGDYNIETLMMGDLVVESIYLGEEQVYANAPFAGLKITPSTLALNSVTTAKTLSIKSSEGWSLSTNDNWIDLSASSGDSGKSVVTVMANSAATSGDSALTATISAVSANYSATVSVSYEPTDPNIKDWCRLNGTSAGTGYIISSVDDEIEYKYAVFNGGQSSWGVFISDLLSGNYDSANIHLSRTFSNERMRVSDYGMTTELGLSTGVVYTYIASKTGATLNGSALTLSGTASLKSQGQITINGQSEGWGAIYLEFRELIITNNGVEKLHIVPYLNNGTTACLKDLVSGNIINATIADIGDDPLE